MKYFVDRFIPHIRGSSTTTLFESVKALQTSSFKSLPAADKTRGSHILKDNLGSPKAEPSINNSGVHEPQHKGSQASSKDLGLDSIKMQNQLEVAGSIRNAPMHGNMSMANEASSSANGQFGMDSGPGKLQMSGANVTYAISASDAEYFSKTIHKSSNKDIDTIYVSSLDSTLSIYKNSTNSSLKDELARQAAENSYVSNAQQNGAAKKAKSIQMNETNPADCNSLENHSNGFSEGGSSTCNDQFQPSPVDFSKDSGGKVLSGQRRFVHDEQLANSVEAMEVPDCNSPFPAKFMDTGGQPIDSGSTAHNVDTNISSEVPDIVVVEKFLNSNGVVFTKGMPMEDSYISRAIELLKKDQNVLDSTRYYKEFLNKYGYIYGSGLYMCVPMCIPNELQDVKPIESIVEYIVSKQNTFHDYYIDGGGETSKLKYCWLIGEYQDEFYYIDSSYNGKGHIYRMELDGTSNFFAEDFLDFLYKLFEVYKEYECEDQSEKAGPSGGPNHSSVKNEDMNGPFSGLSSKLPRESAAVLRNSMWSMGDCEMKDSSMDGCEDLSFEDASEEAKDGLTFQEDFSLLSSTLSQADSSHANGWNEVFTFSTYPSKFLFLC